MNKLMDTLKKKSIGNKLITVFAVVLSCFIIALIISIGSALSIGSKLSTFYNVNYNVVTLQWEMQKSMQKS